MHAEPKASLPKEVPFRLSDLENQASRDMGPSKSSSASFSHRISGQIAAASKSQLSFRVPGFIQKILAEPGDVVKKGDILALLDPADFTTQVNLARIKKNQAQLEENMAKDEFNREKDLEQQGASTGVQLRQAKFKYDQAHIGVQQANLNLESAERNLEYTKLRAPYDCVMSSKYKDQAERIGIETPVFEIYEKNRTEVHLNFPEILMGKIHIGSKLLVTISSINYKDEAVVTKLVPVVSENTRTFKVIATLKNPDPKVVPGLFAEAQIN